MDKRVDALLRLLREGRLSRRAFVRQLGFLGLSLSAAEVLAACSSSSLREVLSGSTPTQTLWPTPTAPKGYIVYPLQNVLHGDNTPTPEATSTAAPTPDPAAKATSTPVMWERAMWACPSCEQRFATQTELLTHIAAQHVRKIPGVRTVSQPTYAQFLTPDIARFDQRNHVFSRAVWDKDYQRELASASLRTSTRPPLEDWDQRAMRQGAIYVDDSVGSLHANYAGFSGHIDGVGGLFGWNDPVAADLFPVSDPAAMSLRVKQVARFLGADLVGITQINPLWVYSYFFDRETINYGQLEIPHKYAIVMAIEMSWPEIFTSPNWGASAATALAYSQMAELAASMAKYIRMLGYPAVPSGNDTVQSIPLAIDAGLGELGRLGLLLTPEFGPRQRLCKVLTNLPLAPDQPIDFGIQRFCESCFVCAKNCPARAIQFGDRTTHPTSISNRPGIRRWPVNVTQCYKFWRENGKDCANCVRACPWSSPSRNWL